ncbi:MAG: prefoldin subunit alpha [Thermoplasmata archaeon]
MSEEPEFNERQFNQDISLLENARAQLDALIKQQQLIQLAIEEHVRARETIKALAKGSPGDEVLVPIGADSYIHARVSDNRNAIVGVGSGTSIRRTPEEAEKIMDSKIDDLSRAFKTVGERAAQLEAAVQELSEKIQRQYEMLQASGRA